MDDRTNTTLINFLRLQDQLKDKCDEMIERGKKEGTVMQTWLYLEHLEMLSDQIDITRKHLEDLQ